MPVIISLHGKMRLPRPGRFETGTDVTVKITEGCIVLMAGGNEMQEGEAGV